ncbi:non-ribosomal peptide synthetase/MFS transporter [Actinokineospora sp. HUAS TT18]|uniref:non-ribosomal peptide synthetase/MFS transporter n=1 Tax=Actinokineospora sp. HUAS TT18 TaxID=3447451 RepID=UPI003F51FA79
MSVEARQALLRQRLSGGARRPTIPRQPADSAPVLSFAQERLWFMEQFAPGSAAYTLPAAVRLRGALDVTALSDALNQVVARHETLRSSFATTDDGSPVLRIADELRVRLDVVEVAEDLAGDAVAEAAAKPFDLTAPPLLRATLFQLAAEDHVLLLTVHHALTDGWSVNVLFDELFAAYTGGSVPSPAVRYRDYAAWQRAQEDDAAPAFWRDRLAGVPPLDLPTDRPRGAQQTFAGGSLGFRVPLADKVRTLATDCGATPYMVLLAAFQVLLSRHSGQTDFAVGSPVAGRSVPELERLVGLFVNLVPMRADLADDPDFAALVTRTRDTALDAWTHQDLPFERLVRDLDVDRDPSRPPIFQVVFAVQNYASARTREVGDLTVTGFPFGLAATRYDLELYLAESGDGYDASLVYNSDLFSADRVTLLADHFTRLLIALLDRPDAPVSTADFLTEGELADLVRRNDTAADFGPPVCLHTLVFDQAERTPDAVAIQDSRGTTTYRELADRSLALASRLAGVERDELVAVAMERGAEQVIACLAIQAAGGAYLPIDPDLPTQRRHQLLARGGCTLAITQPWIADQDWPAGITVLTVPAEPADAVLPEVDPDALGYVIFTSGSTGEPKGVMIDHAAAVNTIRDINDRFAVTADDRVLAVSALSFDLSVWDIYGTLAAGGTLVIPAQESAKDPAAWAEHVATDRITVWDSVPALMELLVEQAEAEGTDLSSLRLVMLSGDWIPLDLPDRIRAVAPDARVISLGGATEGSIWSISYPVEAVDPQWRSIPYGTPLANQSFHILDRHRRPVPDGVAGELHIGGVGVARGYWRDPGRTAASFVSHPETGERLYRTGDLGRYRPDGVIEFLGRADTQVKIRGYRIELGEIEAHLGRHPAVSECVVTVHNGETLVAYVVGEAADLRTYLADLLPAYMVPNRFITLSKLPLSANGKVDRGKLPAPAAEAVAVSAEPETDTERLVVEVWSQVVGSPVAVDADFFSAGGHSLAAIQAVTRLRRALPHAAIGVTDLFRHTTPRAFAALIDRADLGERPLLHRLTPARTGTNLVCVPYGGGQPVAYRPLAEALTDWSLDAVAIPGHDPGVPDEDVPAIEDIAQRCADEVLATVVGPIVLYGHCGVGGAVTVELARRLEAAGREVEAVYLGAVFPFARPRGRIAGALGKLTRVDRLGGVRAYQNQLKAMGADLAGLEPEQVEFMVRSLRRDTARAEEYFTGLLDADLRPLRAPIVSVIGERDPGTYFYKERFREWQFLSDTAALVVLDEAGHYFLQYRAEELADIVTGVHPAVARDAPLRTDTWWLEDTSRSAADVTGPRPGFGRFLAVAVSQLVSFVGTALTDFALPLWIYTTTGSLARFALFMMLAIIPGIVAAPLLGTLVDRSDRRRMMIIGSSAGGLVQLILGVLVWTDSFQLWHAYPLVVCLSTALTLHRLAYISAVPQLVPKHYLGHANGFVQLAGGVAQFVAPIAAVAMLATVGLKGILLFDIAGFLVAIAVLAFVRFPRTMAYVPREPLATEIAQGFRQSLGNPGFRAMLGFFAVLNLLLSPLLMSLLPLSLSLGTMSTAGTIALIGGAGAVLGGLAMIAWGGPPRRRMHGMLLASAVFGVFGVVTGLHAAVPVVAVGAFGLWASLSLVNGIYLTIIHVKAPQRFHGRVIALNQAVAWSTLPIGFAVIAPLAQSWLEPLMAPGGTLASTVGTVIGTGPGRGLALMYVLFGLGIIALSLAATRHRTLSTFDTAVPDADPDDVVGAQALGDRLRRTETAAGAVRSGSGPR